MKTVVSTIASFPAIGWWGQIVDADMVIFETNENFQKMTTRNRYCISGSINPILLSIPLIKGRNQHITMKDIEIFNGDNWQQRHWRTLTSVYKRTPFFEFYEPSLHQLYITQFKKLIDFNHASIAYLKQHLKLGYQEFFSTEYIKTYPDNIVDLRNVTEKISTHQKENFPKYYQIFEDRIGFQPNLSILDLLFSEGPATLAWLKSNSIF